MTPREGARPDWRYRAAALALILLILTPSVLHTWGAVQAARQIARRDALGDNLASAQLGARLIDAQCSTVLAVLRSLAGRPSLVLALQQRAAVKSSAGRAASAQGDEEAIRRHLHDAVELVPDIDMVVAYDTAGRWLGGFPSSSGSKRNVGGNEWFRQCRRLQQPSVSSVQPSDDGPEGGVVMLIVPVGSGARPAAYLAAPVRLSVVERWLAPLRIGTEAVVSVTDAAGRLVATTGDRRPHEGGGESDHAARRALAGKEGAAEELSRLFHRTALVGFAPVRVAHWAVVAAQPAAAALAPAEQLLRPFLLLMLPLLAMTAAAAWRMDRLHIRQARLAHQNASLSLDLAARNERLRAADQAKSEFLANVSHNLRTPLASIKASVSGLLEPDIEWDHDTLRGFLTLVHEEVDRLAAQVRNLLDMARIEGGALPADPAPCDLAEIIDSALERSAPLLAGWSVDKQLAPEPLLIEADYAQIETVLLNLLENAAKYSIPGTTLRIRGYVRRPAERAGEEAVVFALADEGPGLTAGEEEQVFMKFYRSGDHRRAPGTGLGLAICRAIITGHGGTIGARNAPRGGAEFWFSLPRLGHGRAENNTG
jgi:signal transduction histidine kinase